MRAALIACALSIAGVIGAKGQAAAEDGCSRFDWSVDRERELFSDGFVTDVQSETALPKEGVFALVLKPASSVMYLLPPERGRDDRLGGVVTLEWISAGRYQVTVSADAWIDAVQNDRKLTPLATSSRTDCRHPPQHAVRGGEPTAHAPGGRRPGEAPQHRRAERSVVAGGAPLQWRVLERGPPQAHVNAPSPLMSMRRTWKSALRLG